MLEGEGIGEGQGQAAGRGPQARRGGKGRQRLPLQQHAAPAPANTSLSDASVA